MVKGVGGEMENTGRTVQVELTTDEVYRLMSSVDYNISVLHDDADKHEKNKLLALYEKLSAIWSNLDDWHKQITPEYREYTDTCFWLNYVIYPPNEFKEYWRGFTQEELERAAANKVRAAERIGLKSK